FELGSVRPCQSSIVRWRRKVPRPRSLAAGARPTQRPPLGCRPGLMAVDLTIDIENTPGALADVAAAISDAGVNIAAATCLGSGERAELHILVPHAEAVKHLL